MQAQFNQVKATPDGRSAALRLYLEAVRLRARNASSWLCSSGHYARLINREGVVPLTARFRAEDLAFIAKAREELLCFAELGLRLTDLHRPQAVPVAGGPDELVAQCRGCGWVWPCPTFRILGDVLSDHPRRKSAR